MSKQKPISADSRMDFDPAVPMEDIHPPTYSDKLHPVEDEDDEDWDEFRNSVGTEPNKPLEVTPNGDGYDIIDGDRRYRALQQNDADAVGCFIVDGEETLSEKEKVSRMITANEFREPSNKKQKSFHTARFTAPWLLPPGERLVDIDEMDYHVDGTIPLTQGEFADGIGKAQKTISNWLVPMKNEHPLRSTLADMVAQNRPDKDQIKTIDRIVDLLTTGGEDGDPVMAQGQGQFVASELKEMEGPSLDEIKATAEKAADEGWSEGVFLEYVDENYAYDEMERMEEEIDAGMMDGSDPFEDNDYEESEQSYEESGFEDTTGVSVDDVDVDENSGAPDVEFSAPEIDVDWEQYSDLDLGDKNLADVTSKRMISQTLQDDAAVAMNMLSAATGYEHHEIMSKFVEPLVVDHAVGYLNELNQAE